jgi:hypothetical protein
VPVAVGKVATEDGEAGVVFAGAADVSVAVVGI